MRILLGRTILSAALLTFAAAPALSPPARAQTEIQSREGIALENQILALQRSIQILEQQIRQGVAPAPYPYASAPPAGQPPSSSSIDLNTELLSRVTQLEEQVRELRGRVEELGNQVQTSTADLGKQIGDLNFRVQALENGHPAAAPAQSAPAAPAAAAPAQTAPAAARPAAPHRTPEVALQSGEAALARRDYAAAEADARQVLTDFPKSPRAYDAQFLLAQALAGRKNWSAAAVAYDDAYNRRKRGTHAQDSLLGLANALIALGSKGAACGALDQLRVDFAHPREDLRTRIASARSRAGCH